MIQIFKKFNPRWSDILVTMTYTDMTERGIIKSEMPQVCLQLCLFHVHRTFGRKISTDKMGIPSGEKTTMLKFLSEITHAKNEEDYMRVYEEMCLSMLLAWN